MKLFFLFLFLFISSLNFSHTNVFQHGVASGDPLNDRVIIWTKISPINTSKELKVTWQVATDAKMNNVILFGDKSGTIKTDYCIKHDVLNLTPGTWYYYNFICNGDTSLTGRTKTAPLGNIDSVRFAVVSCSNYEHGYFNAYQSIVDRNDVDAVIHLGDYIYEYSAGHYSANIKGRTTYPLNEIITLTDYRDRYGHYRKDKSLQSLHQNFPFINIWDDHEIANNAYQEGAANHTEGIEGEFKNRLSNAKKAYYEWIPIREQKSNKLYRKINYGSNINLLFLDTRVEARDKQLSRKKKDIKNPSRKLLGDEQFDWLLHNLSTDTSVWNIVCQQVMMAPFSFLGKIANPDQWDGYAYEKNKLFDSLKRKQIKNLVVLTGDIHSAWANELPGKKYIAKSGENSLGIEFIAPSVTSIGNIPVSKTIIRLFNRHVKFFNVKKKGFFILDINKKRTQADWYFENTIETPKNESLHGASFYVNKNENHLNKAKSPCERVKKNPSLVNNK